MQGLLEVSGYMLVYCVLCTYLNMLYSHVEVFVWLQIVKSFSSIQLLTARRIWTCTEGIFTVSIYTTCYINILYVHMCDGLQTEAHWCVWFDPETQTLACPTKQFNELVRSWCWGLCVMISCDMCTLCKTDMCAYTHIRMLCNYLKLCMCYNFFVANCEDSCE